LERRAAIVEELEARVDGIDEPDGTGDVLYGEALHRAIAVAFEFGLAVVENGDDHALPVPVELLAQARVAAREGVGLETVVRRYVAGYFLFVDFIIGELQDQSFIDGEFLRGLWRALGAAFERLVASVSDEHARALDEFARSKMDRHEGRVRGILAGELCDTSDIPYDFTAWHIGLVVHGGADAVQAIRRLARSLDRRLLFVRDGETSIWAWLGSDESFALDDLAHLDLSRWPSQLTLAVGAPGQGLTGWRLSHRQALAALPVAIRGGRNVARYADVALLAAILHDDLLATSLRHLYLEPLAMERDGGQILRDTLRAYVSSQRNISSAAFALGVSRRTVANRLRVVESRLGGPLNTLMSGLEAALLLEEVDAPEVDAPAQDRRFR
jgi:hypothetical protein